MENYYDEIEKKYVILCAYKEINSENMNRKQRKALDKAIAYYDNILDSLEN